MAANVVLKNRTGADVTYTGVDTIRLSVGGGNTVDFVLAVPVDIIAMNAEFSDPNSDGNIVITNTAT